jgi:hypothetical protein
VDVVVVLIWVQWCVNKVERLFKFLLSYVLRVVLIIASFLNLICNLLRPIVNLGCKCRHFRYLLSQIFLLLYQLLNVRWTFLYPGSLIGIIRQLFGFRIRDSSRNLTCVGCLWHRGPTNFRDLRTVFRLNFLANFF